MVLIKITDDQMLALAADAAFAPLVQALISVQALATATGFRARRDGYIEVNDKWLTHDTIIAVSQNFGVEIKPFITYVEVSEAEMLNDVPSYLPNATRTVEDIDGNPLEVPNDWSDICTRESLDSTRGITKFETDIDLLVKLKAEAGITCLNHTEALALVNTDYQTNEI